MSLRSCPQCQAQVMSYWKFLLEPVGLQTTTCGKCGAALKISYRAKWMQLLFPVLIVVILFAQARKNASGTESKVIPILVAIPALIATAVLFKWLRFVSSEWRSSQQGTQ